MFFWNSLAFYDFIPKEVVSSLTIRHGRMDKAVYSGLLQFILLQSCSRVWLFATPWTVARQASLPSPTPRVYPNSCPLSQWCHPIISSSVVPFSFCPQSFPASGSFQMSQLFSSGGQSIGVSASVLPMNIQDWFPSGWTGWISLQAEGLSRVFSNTTVQKHQFFGAQLFWAQHSTLTSIHDTGKTTALTRQTLLAKQCLCF